MKKVFSMLFAITFLFVATLPVSAAEAVVNDNAIVSVSYDSDAFEPSAITDKGSDEVSINNDVEVSVSYDSDAVETSAITDKGRPVVTNTPLYGIAATVQDLANGAVGVNWKINAETTSRSLYDYKTNTEKINLKVKAAPSSTSITVYLYNSSGSRVGTSTVTVGTILNTTVTFSNLTSSTNYYFQIKNNDQHDVTLTGSIYQ